MQRDDIAVAMDARTGETLWTAQGAGGTGLMGGASPAADGPLVIVPFSSGELLGILGRNGMTVWGTAITGGRRALARNRINDVTGDPVIVGDTVFASNQSGRTIRLDTRTGERVWTIGEGSYGPASPVGNAVFLVSDEGALVRVDAGTGEIVWSRQLPEFFPARGFLWRKPKPWRAVPYYGPILAGGRLWVASADGWLRAFSPVDGSLLAQHRAPRRRRRGAGGGGGRALRHHPRGPASGFPIAGRAVKGGRPGRGAGRNPEARAMPFTVAIVGRPTSASRRSSTASSGGGWRWSTTSPG